MAAMANESAHLQLYDVSSTTYPAWPTQPKSLENVPYFQATPENLDDLLTKAAHFNTIELKFGPSDCGTVNNTRNCTEACNDPESLFKLNNLRTCIQLAAASFLVRNKTYTVDMSNATTVATLESYQVPNLTTYNATGVFRNTARCLSQSCAVSSLGNCTDRIQGLANIRITGTMDNLENIYSGLSNYCDYFEANINADIGGPGIIVSYLLQTALAVMFYLSLKASTTWTRKLFRCLSWLSYPSKTWREKLRKQGESLQSKVSCSRFGASVVSSLAEFQEVQIYFVASVQIATLISFNPMHPNASSVNSDSYGSALANSVIVKTLSISGVSCILLTQYTLQRNVGLHWWYIFVIMTAVLAMAIAIFAIRGDLMPPADALWNKFMGDAALNMCGNNPSPMTYCRPNHVPYISAIYNTTGTYIVVYLGIVVWVGLLVDQVASTVDKLAGRFPWLQQKLERGKQNVRRKTWLEQGAKEWENNSAWTWCTKIGWIGIRCFIVVYWIAMEIAAIWMVLGYVDTTLILVTSNSTIEIIDSTEWSFGQLIAIMVWAPTVVKYFYFIIFGVEEGFEERIAKNYTIARDADPDKPATRRTRHATLPHAATYPLAAGDTRRSPSGPDEEAGGGASSGTAVEPVRTTW
ncbi:hypothetical protein B0H63DRAFT_184718 [Podospora didyma]|uniref:Uncharacterized protein n=1 Tax=Podospora didyma TaxID=330526 RepID=A0AAE0NQE5_9PEZI|nr:hypothetical protein B0H63DRAFT_184718 [Podospora didyma]